MRWKPDFKNPTMREYMMLLWDEAYLTASQEKLEAVGKMVQARNLEVEKFEARSKRKRMKRALDARKVVPIREMKKAANL